jgi:hypothetical protein
MLVNCDPNTSARVFANWFGANTPIGSERAPTLPLSIRRSRICSRTRQPSMRPCGHWRRLSSAASSDEGVVDRARGRFNDASTGLSVPTCTSASARWESARKDNLWGQRQCVGGLRRRRGTGDFACQPTRWGGRPRPRATPWSRSHADSQILRWTPDHLFIQPAPVSRPCAHGRALIKSLAQVSFDDRQPADVEAGGPLVEFTEHSLTQVRVHGERASQRELITEELGDVLPWRRGFAERLPIANLGAHAETPARFSVFSPRKLSENSVAAAAKRPATRSFLRRDEAGPDRTGYT